MTKDNITSFCFATSYPAVCACKELQDATDLCQSLVVLMKGMSNRQQLLVAYLHVNKGNTFRACRVINGRSLLASLSSISTMERFAS